MTDWTMLSPAFSAVLRRTELSIQAEQVFCSIVTEMTFHPQFENQPGLKTVHKQNYETSYHRNTAAGNLQRLLTRGDETDTQLVLMTVECFIEARRHDKLAEQALQTIVAPTPADERWLEAAAKWHHRRKQQLKYAAKKLYSTIGPDMWAQGASLAE